MIYSSKRIWGLPCRGPVRGAAVGAFPKGDGHNAAFGHAILELAVEPASNMLSGRAEGVEGRDTVDVVVIEKATKLPEVLSDLDEVETHAFVIKSFGFEHHFDPPAVAVDLFGLTAIGTEPVGSLKAVSDA